MTLGIQPSSILSHNLSNEEIFIDGRLIWKEHLGLLLLLLLLDRLTNHLVKVFRSIGRRSPLRFYCHSCRRRRAVVKVVGVVRLMKAVVAMVA